MIHQMLAINFYPSELGHANKIFERRLYAVNREAGLQTFLEHRLHDHKFMANKSLSRLKELAQSWPPLISKHILSTDLLGISRH